MAMHMKNEQEPKKRAQSGRGGFYAALAICVLAIGIAAWSTYDMFSGYLEPAGEDTAAQTVQNSVTPAEKEDPERYTAEGHGHGTAAAVRAEEKTAEATPTPTAAAKPEKSEKPESKSETSGAGKTTVSAEAAETAAEPVIYTVSETFLCPVSSGKILAPYTETPVYSETMRDYRVHPGTDYAAERGETVKAAANGLVKNAYTDMLLGNILVIEHGGVELSYCGLGETFLVKPGEIVFAGQDIGCITAAPYESAMTPHLHLEAVKNGEVIDPDILF